MPSGAFCLLFLNILYFFFYLPDFVVYIGLSLTASLVFLLSGNSLLHDNSLLYRYVRMYAQSVSHTLCFEYFLATAHFSSKKQVETCKQIDQKFVKRFMHLSFPLSHHIHRRARSHTRPLTLETEVLVGVFLAH